MSRSIRNPIVPWFGAALCVLFSACASTGGAGSAPVQPRPGSGLSAADEAWVNSTLASLTLREKVGQMVMPWVLGDYTALDAPEFERLAGLVEHGEIGGVVMSMGLPLSYAAKLNALQQRAKVPLLVASDMENGPGMRMSGIYALPTLLPMGGGTAFPPLMALGATGSDSLAYQLGRVLAAEARAVGVNVVFGPILDVNSNPANPIINTRSFGEDPAEVGRLATAYIRGAHDGGLLATGKHFPGHGDVSTDSHIDLPVIRADRARLDSVELPPFRAAIAAGVDGIMTAHIAVVGVEGPNAPPATMSHYFQTELLRDEMKFHGLLYTDALDMGAIVKRYGPEEAVLKAVEAGADVLLMPHDPHAAVEAVAAAVESGRIPESRIDASVRRILEAKARAGLRTSKLVDLTAVNRVVGTSEHWAVARTVAERSITLARDDRSLVPLSAQARRLLVVTYASPADLVAGKTFDGALEAAGKTVDAVRVDSRTTAEEFDALRARADSADLVVVAAFVSPRAHSGEIGAGGGLSGFVEGLSVAGKPVVAISFGSPYLFSSFPSVPAYMLAWGGEDVSQEAAARALLGTAPITGRLPVTIPPAFHRGEGITRAAVAEAASR